MSTIFPASDHDSAEESSREEEDEGEEEDVKLSQHSTTEEEELDEEDENDGSDHVDENDNLAQNEKKIQTSSTMPIKLTTINPAVRSTANTKEESGKKNKSKSIPMATKKRASTEIMVKKALIALNDRSGSSVAAIKKYIVTNFEIINDKRLGPLIYKYLKKSVTEGTIEQKKRSFKMINDKMTEPKKPKTLKLTTVKKTNPSNQKKNASAKTASSSTAKVAAKTAAVSSNASKEKDQKKLSKTVKPVMADVLKPQRSKSKTTKDSEPSISSATVSDQAKPNPKAKRPLYVDKESVVSVKVPKKMNTKSKASERPKEEPSSSKDSDEPSSSKQNIQKSKSKKTKK